MTEKSGVDSFEGFYFWLGDEMESVTKEEFEKKQEEVRENERKWKDVVLDF